MVVVAVFFSRVKQFTVAELNKLMPELELEMRTAYVCDNGTVQRKWLLDFSGADYVFKSAEDCIGDKMV